MDRKPTRQESPMPVSIRGLTPLLQVFDLPKAIAFYRDILGFEVVSLSGQQINDSYWAMLKLGDSTLMLNTAYEDDKRPPQPDPARVRAHLDTALFFGCESGDEVYAHLRARGWDAREPVNTHYGMRQVYTRDPDGFELCFQHPVK
jgi:catechol 2,3-dioxygenase-like lactoylglutathione lyase family enzyme